MIDHERSSVYLCRFLELMNALFRLGVKFGQNQVLPTKTMWQLLFPTLSSIAMGTYDTGNLWLPSLYSPFSIMFLYFLWLEGWPWQSNHFKKAVLSWWLKRIASKWEHSWKLTRNLKITQFKRGIIFQTSIFGFHVNFPGVKLFQTPKAP